MKIYTVRAGDTVYGIARRFGTSPDDIIYANQLSQPDALSVGQSLVIPVDSVTHIVQRGQSVYSIAVSYGVTVQDILRANPSLGNGNRIYPGQRITVPFPNENLGSALMNGFVTDVSDSALKAQLPYLSFLSPFSYSTDADGNLRPVEFGANTALSAAYATANLITLTNLKESGGFSSQNIHAILTQQQPQDAFLENLIGLLQSGDWYGVNVDFEYIYAFDRESYNQFLRRLVDTLHPLGYIVVTCLAPKVRADQPGLLYEAHDYAFHGRTADYVIVMTYEWGYKFGPPMAVSPIGSMRQVLDYAVSEIPRGKIMMSLPNYGYDWTLPFTQGTAARILNNVSVPALAARVGAAILFDARSQTPYFNYTDAAGRRHEVWFDDARSLHAKYHLIDEYGLAGVSFWNLNSLFRTNFLVFESMYSVRKLL